MVTAASLDPRTAKNSSRWLVLTGHFLFPDHDGGSRHMLMLLQGLERAGCHVTYFALLPIPLKTFTGTVGEAVALLTDAGISLAYPPDTRVALSDYLEEYGRTFDYVMVYPENVAMTHYALIRQQAPQARVIFNTIDLAHVRLFRKAKLSPDLPALQSAIQAKRREVWLTNHCDTTFVVSAEERQTLAALCPEADIRVIPSVWHPMTHNVPYAKREGLLFVGSFPYEANVDAVLYFVAEIYPILAPALGEVPFYIVGAAPPPVITALSDTYRSIVVTGQVPSVEPYFLKARVFIAPVRYGAGIKTKTLYSMSCGLPVVTTTIGAEGLHLQDGENAFIADEPVRFANAVVQLYQDESLWSRIAGRAGSVMAEHFSGQALDATLADVLGSGPSGGVAHVMPFPHTGGTGD